MWNYFKEMWPWLSVTLIFIGYIALVSVCLMGVFKYGGLR